MRSGKLCSSIVSPPIVALRGAFAASSIESWSSVGVVIVLIFQRSELVWLLRPIPSMTMRTNPDNVDPSNGFPLAFDLESRATTAIAFVGTFQNWLVFHVLPSPPSEHCIDFRLSLFLLATSAATLRRFAMAVNFSTDATHHRAVKPVILID